MARAVHRWIWVKRVRLINLGRSSLPMSASDDPDFATKSARVYINKRVEDIPPHPGNEWTRFVCISDTHMIQCHVPAGDVLLHAGDIGYGRNADIVKMFGWLGTLPHKKKVIIAGNHDLCLDARWKSGSRKSLDESDTAQKFVRSPEVRQAGIYYLEHERLELDTENGRIWKIYGSPATRRYATGAFQYETDQEGEAIYSRIPIDTEILMTHTPSHRTLDFARRGGHAGCPMLAAKLAELGSCKLHICGHIHEGYGAVVGPNDRISVNAAVAEDRPSIVVDLRNSEQ